MGELTGRSIFAIQQREGFEECIVKKKKKKECIVKQPLSFTVLRKDNLASPGLLEPTSFHGSGWQIHHNKVQRPEEIAHCRNEPTAARRSPETVKERE